MQAYPWFEVYRLALLELDSNKIPERLALARQNLNTRIETMGLEADERQAIADALNNLRAVELSEG